jgi:hypothetical protein
LGHLGRRIMASILTIIKQDLDVAKKGINADDFNFILFIGNRIMTNSLVNDKNGFMLLGYIVRELGAELLFIQKNRKDKLDDAKSDAIAYLDSLRQQISSEKFHPIVFLEMFYGIEVKFRDYMLSDYETGVYDEQSEFSKDFALKMLDVLYSNRDNISLKNNNLIGRIANELGRNFNEHAGEDALIVYLIFRAFDNYYSYSRKSIEDKNTIRKEDIKLNDFVEKIYSLKCIISENRKHDLYIQVINIINDLGKEYRILYLNFSLPYAELEEKVELSEETKQKLGEAIMQSLHMPKKKKSEKEEVL